MHFTASVREWAREGGGVAPPTFSHMIPQMFATSTRFAKALQFSVAIVQHLLHWLTIGSLKPGAIKAKWGPGHKVYRTIRTGNFLKRMHFSEKGYFSKKRSSLLMQNP